MNYQHMPEEGFGTKGSAKPQEVQAGIFSKAAGTEDFPYDQIPGDFEKAMLHKEAWRVGHGNLSTKAIRRMQKKGTLQDEQAIIGKMCNCCARKVPSHQVSIGCVSRDYSFLGTGLPLYFEYIKSCILMLLIMFVTSGDYNIITNMAYGTDCEKLTDPKQTDDNEFCALTWVTQLSLANKRKDLDFIDLQQMLNLISMITLIVLFQFFRKGQREMDQEIDNSTHYASDFTVLVKKIPTHAEGLLNNDFDDDLKAYFESYVTAKYKQTDDMLDYEEDRKEVMMKNQQYYKPLDRIAAVNLCYRLDEQFEKETLKQRKIAEKQTILTQLYKEGIEPNDPQLQKDSQGVIQNQKISLIQNEIDLIELQLEALEEKFHQGKDVKDYFLGLAFITFQWESDVQEFLRENRVSSFMRFFGRKSNVEYRGVYLDIDEPPEPTDVYWENLHVKNIQKVIRRLSGYIITFVILGLCGLSIYQLTAVQANAAKDQAAAMKQGDQDAHTGVKLLAYIASILIIVINIILGMVIDQIAKFEKYSTQTGYNISLASKSSMAQFCNTAVITFLINTLITKNTYGQGGLIYNQTYVFLTNCVVPAIIQLIDSGTVAKWIFQKLEKNKGNRSIKTQRQLNELFEKPAFNISTSYAAVLKNMYVVAFYAAIIPLGLVVTCIALLTHYWVEKYNIARRRTIKYNYSSVMSIQMIEQLEFVLPIYCISNLWWEYEFSGGADISNEAIIGVALGFVNALLPMQEINELIFPLSSNVEEIIPVETAEEHFLTDYARENPATQERARADYTQRIENHKKIVGIIQPPLLKSVQGMFGGQQ